MDDKDMERTAVTVKGMADNLEDFMVGFPARVDAQLSKRLAPIREALHMKQERDGLPRLGGDPEDDGGFESFGEFIHQVRFDRADGRLRKMLETR